METRNELYLKTYNYVYLRAKSIMNKEEDVQQLMKEVYIHAFEQEVKEEKLISWMGKQVYSIGCSKFRKKNLREADTIELQEEDYYVAEGDNLEETKDVICDTLEELPDLYQATLYALYYDQLSVKEIADLTGYSTGAVINRLNYIHKYLKKTLAFHAEDHEVSVRFSVEAVYEALVEWSEQNGLQKNVAKNIYGTICREIGVTTDELQMEDENGGTDFRIRPYDGDVVDTLREEMTSHKAKFRIDLEPKVLVIAGIGIVAVLLLVGMFFLGKFMIGKLNEAKEKAEQPKIEQEVEPEEEEEIFEPEEEEIVEEEVPAQDEYIFPNSATVLLTRADLQGMDAAQLRLARNEIFARYGVIFGPADLKTYFEGKSWYEPKISFDYFEANITMNQTEKENISLIVQVEDEVARQ